MTHIALAHCYLVTKLMYMALETENITLNYHLGTLVSFEIPLSCKLCTTIGKLLFALITVILFDFHYCFFCTVCLVNISFVYFILKNLLLWTLFHCHCTGT